MAQKYLREMGLCRSECHQSPILSHPCHPPKVVTSPEPKEGIGDWGSGEGDFVALGEEGAQVNRRGVGVILHQRPLPGRFGFSGSHG